MPINNIDIGTAPDNKTGDELRLGGQKINANFAYLKELIDDITKVVKVETVPTTGEEKILYAESSTGQLKIWNGTGYDVYGGGEVTYQNVIDALGFVPKDITEQQISNWESAFNGKINSASITGDANKTLTLTLQDGSTITASFVDNNDGSGTATDDVLNTLEFNINNDGVLQATTETGVPITVNLDGRYSLLEHSHTAAEITETDTRKFVSPTEKSTWNNKVNNSRVLTDVPENAVFTDTVYNDTHLSERVTEVEQNKANDSEVLKGILNPDGTERPKDAEGKVTLPEFSGGSGSGSPQSEQSFVFAEGGSQTFIVTSGSKVTDVYVQGQRLHTDQWNVISDTQIEILDTLSGGNIIVFVTSAAGGAPIANHDNPYITLQAMYDGQGSQTGGWLYKVTGEGLFLYNGTTSGTAADYEQIGGFTNIAENEFGTHPAFTNQHDLNAYLLGNFNGDGTAPTLTVSDITHESFDYQITE